MRISRRCGISLPSSAEMIPVPVGVAVSTRSAAVLADTLKLTCPRQKFIRDENEGKIRIEFLEERNLELNPLIERGGISLKFFENRIKTEDGQNCPVICKFLRFMTPGV